MQLSKNDMTAEEAEKHWEQEKVSGKTSDQCEGKNLYVNSCSSYSLSLVSVLSALDLKRKPVPINLSKSR